MKLTDIRGAESLDIIADLIPLIAEIAMDKEASEVFSRKELPKGKSVAEFMLERIRKSVPALVKNHKSSVVGILAILAEKTTEEYEETMSPVSVCVDFMNIFNDEALLQLFSSAQNQ